MSCAPHHILRAGEDGVPLARHAEKPDGPSPWQLYNCLYVGNRIHRAQQLRARLNRGKLRQHASVRRRARAPSFQCLRQRQGEVRADVVGAMGATGVGDKS